MNRKKLITIIFQLLAIGLLLWLAVLPKNQSSNHNKKAPVVAGIGRELPTHAVNSQVSRETRIDNSCQVTDEQAIAAAVEFIHKIGLGFQGAPNVRDLSLSNVDYPGRRLLKDVTYNYPNGRIKYRSYIGCESGAVENFENLEEWGKYIAASDMKEPYGLQRTIEYIAQQIGIPPDMKFDKVEKDWRKNVWLGKFNRTRDGFKYDLDNVAIGISGKTGKIASYRKIYFGQSCPTEIKIQKDEAIRMTSTEFNKFIFGKVRSHSDELYDRNERLLIVQPERSKWALGVGEIANPPLKEKPSRLAWVIRYNFTGGIKFQKGSKPVEEMSPQERQMFDRQISEYEYLLSEYGNPVDSFEMRIDAGNGEILYVSHKDPEYYSKNRRCK